MMIFNKVKSFLIKYWIFYLVGFIFIFGIKYFYSKADSSDLEWILAPTTWWVSILSGITFKNKPHVGYISHEFRFIIAASCSGIQFMIITIATLIYSFVHRMRTMKRGFCWIALSLLVSYLFTIFINGIRIVFSIYFPIYLHKSDIYNGGMTPERLHTTIGIVVYFTSLFTIYHIALYVSQKIADMPERNPDFIGLKYPGKSFMQIICKYIPPIFWYFSIALGIPFLNKAYKNHYENFMEYAMLMATVCFSILSLFFLVSMIRKHFSKRKNSFHNLSCHELENR